MGLPNDPAQTLNDLLYVEQQKQARLDFQTTSDDYDKNLLAVSSGALGLSLSFIKDIVPLDKAFCLSVLYVSWCSFALAILITISSYLFALAALRTHLKILDEYYRNAEEATRTGVNSTTRLVRAARYIAGGAFLVGLLLTLLFCILNVRSMSARAKLPPDSKGTSSASVPVAVVCCEKACPEGPSLPAKQDKQNVQGEQNGGEKQNKAGKENTQKPKQKDPSRRAGKPHDICPCADSQTKPQI